MCDSVPNLELPSDERSAARFARIERGLGELAKGQVGLAAALERIATAAASRPSRGGA